MKIVGLLFFCCLQAQLSFAQFEKGKAAVGLSIGFSYDNVPDDGYYSQKEFSFVNDLNGELFVHRNVSVVFGFGFEQINTNSTRTMTDSVNNRYFYDNQTKAKTIAPIFGIRKYWFTKEGKFGLFVMPYAIVSFTTIQFEQTFTSPTYKNNAEGRKDYWSPYFRTDIGGCYFVKPNFSLELTSNILEAYADKNRQYIYFLRDLSSLRYGIRYYF